MVRCTHLTYSYTIRHSRNRLNYFLHRYFLAGGGGSVCILLEICEYGSLADILRGDMGGGRIKQPLGLSLQDRMWLALGCARYYLFVCHYVCRVCVASCFSRSCLAGYVCVVYSACRGVAALHRLGPAVVHRDIKSLNFLGGYPTCLSCAGGVSTYMCECVSVCFLVCVIMSCPPRCVLTCVWLSVCVFPVMYPSASMTVFSHIRVCSGCSAEC